MRHRRGPMVRVTAAVVALAALFSCTGGDDGSSPSAATSRGCRHVERLKDLAWDLESPGVFALEPGELEDLLEDERHLLSETLRAVADEELREQIIEYVDDREVTDVARVRLFTEERARMEQVGWAWESWAFSQRDLVSQVEHDTFVRERSSGTFDILEAKCVHPELAVTLEEDPSGAPPGGTILFKELGPDARAGLVAVSVAGGIPVELAPPADWDALHYPWVDPDTDTVLAIALREDGTETAVVEGTVATGFHELFVPPQPMVLDCVSRAGDGSLLTTTRLASGGTLLLRVDQAGEIREVDLPLTNPYCAHPVGEGLVVLGGHDVREFGEVTHLVGDELTEATRLTDQPDCNALLGDVDASTGQVLTFSTCADAGESGMHLRTLDGRSATHLLQGRVAAPSLSPDGRWVTFGYSPLGMNLVESVRIWVMRTDGSGARMVTDTASSFPVWTADEL